MFWINNPTRRQADLAIEHGALGCTNNPSYTQKMIDHPEEESLCRSQLLDEAIRETDDEWEAAEVFQRKMVKPIADKFMPLFEKSGGQHGYVSIQGDPINEDDPDVVIRDALANRKALPQHLLQNPHHHLRAEGHGAHDRREYPDQRHRDLWRQPVRPHLRDLPADQPAHRAQAACSTCRTSPASTTITCRQLCQGEQRRYLAGRPLPGGLAVARKVYEMMIEREYPCTFIGGGARGLHHFTEMVGGKVCITINWEGTADKLIEQNPPVVYRLFNPVPQKVIDELMEKLPDFKRGYLEDGLERRRVRALWPGACSSAACLSRAGSAPSSS